MGEWAESGCVLSLLVLMLRWHRPLAGGCNGTNCRPQGVEADHGLGHNADGEGVLLGAVSNGRRQKTPHASEVRLGGGSAVHEPAQSQAPSDDVGRHEYVREWERAHPGEPFPSPWQEPNDSRGWHVAARGKKWPARPEGNVDLPVTLPPDDYVWLARRAREMELRPSELLARIVARMRNSDGEVLSMREAFESAEPSQTR